MIADFHTDFPDRFQQVDSVCLEKPGYEEWHYLESFWFQKGRIVLKFKGVSDPDSARELVGCEVRVPEEERFSLPEDYFYDSDLKGCLIVEKGSLIGKVKDVFRPGGDVSNLVIVNDAGLEFMIPLVSDFCLEINLDKGEIEVDLPPGIQELAVPEEGRGKKQE